MTPYDTLMAQALVLAEAANREYAKLVTLAAPQASGLAKLNKLVSSQLRESLNERIQRLEKFLNKTSQATNLAAAHGEFREIEFECRSLFSECLALSIAPVIRSLDLDDSACAITEDLLRGLGDQVGVPWPHLTTLADSERFTTASQVIRLRYPASDIWDYPIAAHEFGHFVGSRMPLPNEGPTAFQTFLGILDLGPKSHLEEYFSDLLATFLIGPAYVNTCLLHRFDPTSARDTDHPTDRHRAVWILTGLEQLAKQSQGRSAEILKLISTNRCSEWTAAVAASGADPIDVETVAILRTRARRLWGALVAWRGSAAYTDIGPAMTLRKNFPNEPRTEFQVRDLLNAAWLLRIDRESDFSNPKSRAAYFQDIGTINTWAKNLCLRGEL